MWSGDSSGRDAILGDGNVLGDDGAGRDGIDVELHPDRNCLHGTCQHQYICDAVEHVKTLHELIACCIRKEGYVGFVPLI
jgi:hypothetical protein